MSNSRPAARLACRSARCCVRDISARKLAERSLYLAATIIAMARQLHLTVIAEGVETPPQLNYLQEQGCDQYQGRHASARIDGSALATLLA